MIGSNLVKRLAIAGERVSVVDNLWRGRREYLLDERGAPVIEMEQDFHQRDLSQTGALDDLIDGIDIVYHLADVVGGIGFVFNNESAVFRQNMLINSNVIAACRKNGVSGFVYTGTACSFPAELQNDIDAPPLRECDQYPANPESAYGWSKLMGEYEALLMEKETGIPVSVLSLHNVFGSPCDFTAETSQVIPALIRKAVLSPEEPFVVWGSGSQGRAFVHVDEVVDALIATMDKGLGQGVIQIGPDRCTSIAEVAHEIVRISGKHIDIEFDNSKPEGDRGRCADFSKATEILGWTPRHMLSADLEALYRWVEREIRKLAD